MNPLHKEIYMLLCEIDDICREHGIVYYLHAGSVIGAVRHGGMIPWDDDADVMMTAENYRKFQKAFASEERPQRALVSLQTHKNFVFPYVQYKDISTTVLPQSGLFPDYPNGLFVDIMIMDPVAEDPALQKRHIENLKLLSEIVSHSYVVNRESNQKRYHRWLLLQKLIGRERTIRILTKRLERGDSNACAGYIQRVGVYPVFWDRKFFQEPEYHWFGPRQFPTPTYTYEYLRYTYGDAWTVYPDDREGHGFLYSSVFPFQVIQNEYKNAIDCQKFVRGWKNYKYWRFKAVRWENAVRICNSRRSALLYRLAVEGQISDKELIRLYKDSRYADILSRTSVYIDNQLKQPFISDHIPFQVSDTVFRITCMTLILTGRYDLAQKLSRSVEELREEYPSFEEVEQAILQTRELSVAYYEDGCDWNRIARLSAEGLRRYPHHVDFFAARCGALMNTAKEPARAAEAVINLCQNELRVHPNQGFLLKQLADAQMSLGKRKKAIANYQKAFHMTNDGMLRRAIQEAAQRYLFTVKDSSPRKSNEWYRSQVQQAQSKILTMLQELDRICRKNGIPYFLGGYLAAEAVALKTFAPECCSAYIVMRPSDRERFLLAAEKKKKKDRALESFESNRNYPDFSIRYCDTSTTLFNMKTEGFYQYHALNVAVYFLRSETRGRCPSWIKSGLLAAIEACALPRVRYNQTRRKRIAGILGRIYLAICGKRRGKRLAWKLIYHPQSTETRIKGSIKSYWAKEIKLPLLDFGKSSLCYLKDRAFPVPSNFRAYIAPQVTRNWNNGKPVGLQLLGENVAAMDVPCSLFIQGLEKLDLRCQYAYVGDRLYRCNKRCSEKSAYTQTAWNIAFCAFDRYTLWARFMPQKQRILALHAERNYRALEIALGPYLNKLQYHAKYKLPLVFDNDIFRISWELLERQGRGGTVVSLLPAIPQKYFQPIKYRVQARKTIGAMAMKKAIKEERQMILDYLRKDVANCLYLYADIAKYGVESENMKVWYDTDEQGIRMVVMKYHTNFQVYANRNFENTDGLLGLIDQEFPMGVSAREEIIGAIKERLQDRYAVETGVIYKGKPINGKQLRESLSGCDAAIELAEPEDAPKIARLLLLDEELSKIYTEESLTRELRERIETGMGRSYIIRDGDRIAAHNATYAESDLFVVISGLMIHPDYRDRDYAYWIDLKSSLEFQLEGKERYFMAVNPKIMRWHKFAGTPIAGHYGKLSRIDRPDQNTD
ncbi:MAG: hypothetical protein HFE43_07865 [Oscillospiraceae bacterium]|jgi:phosphorylcholine metabolism protein LicD/predicted GNAT family acetyltransferase|nr:hypothetical protein [Oscillospiraceae bacterium]